jgi:hypothetical protein
MIFQAIRSALSQDDEEPARHVYLSLEETLSELAQGLQQSVGELNLDRPDVMEEVMVNYLRLRKRNLESSLATLQLQVQTAQDEPGNDQGGLATNVKGLLERVNLAKEQKRRLEGALARHIGTADLSPAGGGLIG